MVERNPVSTLHEEFRTAINEGDNHLREALKNGDDRLREHIDRQIEQVQAALVYSESQIRIALEASEKLETERVGRVQGEAETEFEHLTERVEQGAARMDAHITLQRTEIASAIAAVREGTHVALASANTIELERIEVVERNVQSMLKSLDERVVEGDHRLREHIQEQVGQIREALIAMQRETGIAHEAARELEVTRVAEIKNVMQTAVKALELRVDDRVNGAQREVKIAFDAAQEAINKAEQANEKRFAGQNDFRGELSERWAQTMPREVAEALIASLAEKIADAERNMNERVRALEMGSSETKGGSEQSRRSQDRTQPWTIWAAGFAVTLFVTVMLFLANLLTKAPA